MEHSQSFAKLLIGVLPDSRISMFEFSPEFHNCVPHILTGLMVNLYNSRFYIQLNWVLHVLTSKRILIVT